jgi:hypothetical protein
MLLVQQQTATAGIGCGNMGLEPRWPDLFCGSYFVEPKKIPSDSKGESIRKKQQHSN